MHAVTFSLRVALAAARSLVAATSSTPTSDFASFASDNVCVQQCADYVVREGGLLGCTMEL